MNVAVMPAYLAERLTLDFVRPTNHYYDSRWRSECSVLRPLAMTVPVLSAGLVKAGRRYPHVLIGTVLLVRAA
jgi:hypothetical protein